jgi:hypothetical protein
MRTEAVKESADSRRQVSRNRQPSPVCSASSRDEGLGSMVAQVLYRST